MEQQTILQWTELFSLEQLRTKEANGELNISAVYLWGWFSADRAQFFPYYVGKTLNLKNRVFEHLGKLLGGHYTIYKFESHQANTFTTGKSSEDLLYVPAGVGSIIDFYRNQRLQENVKKLVDNIHFCWTVTDSAKNSHIERAVYRQINQTRLLGSTVRGESAINQVKFTGNSFLDPYNSSDGI